MIINYSVLRVRAGPSKENPLTGANIYPPGINRHHRRVGTHQIGTNDLTRCHTIDIGAPACCLTRPIGGKPNGQAAARIGRSSLNDKPLPWCGIFGTAKRRSRRIDPVKKAELIARPYLWRRKHQLHMGAGTTRGADGGGEILIGAIVTRRTARIVKKAATRVDRRIAHHESLSREHS